MIFLAREVLLYKTQSIKPSVLRAENLLLRLYGIDDDEANLTPLLHSSHLLGSLSQVGEGVATLELAVLDDACR